MNLVFQEDQIQDALKNKNYNHTMSMYLILKTKKPKVGCRTILGRLFCLPDIDSRSLCPTHLVHAESFRTHQPEDQELAEE